MRAVSEQVLGYLFDIGAADAKYLCERGWITAKASKVLSVNQLCRVAITRHLIGQGSNIDLTNVQKEGARSRDDLLFNNDLFL